MSELGTLFTGIFILGGSLFVFAATVGIVRLPDLFLRMHAATKAGTLGTGLILIGSIFYFWEMGVVTRGLVTLFFIVMSAPVAAHTIARASYIYGTKLFTEVDELKIYREKQEGGEVAQSEQASESIADELADFD